MTRVVGSKSRKEKERDREGERDGGRTGEDRMQMDGVEMRRHKEEARWRGSRGLLEEINNGSVTLPLPLPLPPAGKLLEIPE